MIKSSVFFLILLLVSAVSPQTRVEAQLSLDSRVFEESGGVRAELNKSSGELMISKWDGEAYFKISTLDLPISNRVEDTKEVLEYGSYIAKIFEVPEGFEFDIIYSSRPESNTTVFRIKSKGLEFYFQAPLSDQVFPKGWTVNETHAFNGTGHLIKYRPRPYSYAVYGLKKNNDYGTGKIGEILRPLIYDAKGSEVFGEILIEGELLSITAPDNWLDNAVYPITYDPTFGKTAIGGSQFQTGQDVHRATHFTLNDDALITDAYFYSGPGDGGPGVRVGYWGVYDDDSGSPDNRLMNAKEVISWADDGWKYNDYFNDVLAPGVYWLNGATDVRDHHFFYDDGPADSSAWKYNSNEQPDPFAEDGLGIEIFSTFVNYTVIEENYYLVAENLTISTRTAGLNATVSMDVETNSTPAFYWFGYNSSGEMVNTTARAWTDNGTVSGWVWISPQIDYLFTVIGYANSSDNINSTSASFRTVSETVNLITESLWISLIIWVFVTLFGQWKEDDIVKMISAIVGVIFGILYLRTSLLFALGMILLNLYLLYDAMIE